MKKNTAIILFSLLIVFFKINTSLAGGAAKLGLDFSGNHELSLPGKNTDVDNVDNGFCLSLEVFKTVNKAFDLGAGTTYQIPRAVSFQEDEGYFNFWPVYGMIRVRLGNGDIDPYLVGQIGYNFFSADDDYGGTAADYEGGMYWALGGGMIVNKHLLIEMLYSVNNGQVSLYENDIDVENSQITINIGYNF